MPSSDQRTGGARAEVPGRTPRDWERCSSPGPRAAAISQAISSSTRPTATYPADHFTAIPAPSATPAASLHGRPSASRLSQPGAPRSSPRGPRERPPSSDHEQDGGDDEERHERVEHRDARLHEVEEVRGQEGRSGGRAHRRGRREDVPRQEPPHQQVEQRDAQDARHRRGDPPAELVVAEEPDPDPDEPVPERRMGAADQVVDPAGGGGVDDEAAGVAGVEDLVEDEAGRGRQPGEPERGGPQRDHRHGHPVAARPGRRIVDGGTPFALQGGGAGDGRGPC